MNNIKHGVTKQVTMSVLSAYILGFSTISRVFFCYYLKHVAFLSLVLVREAYIIYTMYINF